MFDVNEMMLMLDWNNDLETQEEGKKLASKIRCLSLFMQPMDKGYGKNIWDNSRPAMPWPACLFRGQPVAWSLGLG